MGEGRGETDTESWNTAFPWPMVHKSIATLQQKY